jgi:hypothetical protein
MEQNESDSLGAMFRGTLEHQGLFRSQIFLPWISRRGGCFIRDDVCDCVGKEVVIMLQGISGSNI